MYSPTFNLSWWFFEEIYVNLLSFTSVTLNWILLLLFNPVIVKKSSDDDDQFFLFQFLYLSSNSWPAELLYFHIQKYHLNSVFGATIGYRCKYDVQKPNQVVKATTKPTKCHSNLCMLMFFYFTSIRIQFRNFYRLVVMYVRRRTHVNILIFISSIPCYR